MIIARFVIYHKGGIWWRTVGTKTAFTAHINSCSYILSVSDDEEQLISMRAYAQ